MRRIPSLRCTTLKLISRPRYSTQLEKCQQLSLMNGSDGIDRLNFNYHSVLNQDIQPEFNTWTALAVLMSEGRTINR